MNENDIENIRKQIESELNGEPEHDADVLIEWGERLRAEPDSEELLYEISRRLFDLAMEEDGDSIREVFEDIVNTAEEDYADACGLIERKQYDEALHKLYVLMGIIQAYPIAEDEIRMDFASYLDSMLFQDIYSEEIGSREILRHPMRPARMLFTLGSLLIESERAEDAIEPLELLLTFDPVCPKYLFELGEAYKRTGRIRDAYSTAKFALLCASTREELARGYRDLAYCLTETKDYEDAVMLYQLSLRFQSSRHANAEIIWIRKKTGVALNEINDSTMIKRCNELEIPVGFSQTVQKNKELLDMLMGGPEK